jgi:hypothetical protein
MSKEEQDALWGQCLRELREARQLRGLLAFRLRRLGEQLSAIGGHLETLSTFGYAASIAKGEKDFHYVVTEMGDTTCMGQINCIVGQYTEADRIVQQRTAALQEAGLLGHRSPEE